MLKIVSLPTTNQVNDKDWAKATKDLKIGAYVDSKNVCKVLETNDTKDELGSRTNILSNNNIKD